MKVRELKAVIRSLGLKDGDEIGFSNDYEGNTLYRIAHLQPTKLDDTERLIWIFYPTNQSIIDIET